MIERHHGFQRHHSPQLGTTPCGDAAGDVSTLLDRLAIAERQVALLSNSNEALRRSVEKVSQSGRFDSLLESLLLESMHVIGAAGGVIALWANGRFAGHQCVAERGEIVPPRQWESDPFFSSAAAFFNRDADGFASSLAALPYTRSSLEWATEFWPEAAAYHARRGHVEVWNVPCVSRGVLVAVLGLAFAEQRPAEPVLIETLTALAQQMALMREMTRIVKDAEEAAVAKDRETQSKRISEFLVQMVSRLSRDADLSTVLESLVTELAAAVGASHLMLFRHDGETRTLRLDLSVFDGRIRWGLSRDELPLWGQPFPDDVTPAWRIMCEQRGLFTPDYTPIPAEEFAWPGAFDYARNFQLSDMAHIVLFAGDLPVGSMGLGFRNGQKLQLADKAFIEAAAQQAAIIIRMIDLGEEAKRAAVATEREASARQHAAELARTNDALQATIDALPTIESLDLFVPAALRVVATAFGSSNCSYFEHLPGEPIYLRYWLKNGRIMGAEELLQISPGGELEVIRAQAGGFEVPDSYLGENVRCRSKAKFIDHRAGTTVPEFDALLVSRGWPFELNVPLVVGGVATGALAIYRTEDSPFTSAEIALAESLAKQLALAIQASRLAKQARLDATAREQERALAQERGRMSREIHDTLAQGYAAILVQVQALKIAMPSLSESGASTHFATVERLARENLARARKTMDELREDPFERSSLAKALDDCIQRERFHSDFQVELEMPADVGTVARYVEVEACRVVQEALSNVKRHARVNKAVVDVQTVGGRLQIAVVDRGAGFDPRQTGGSFGIAGMKERAARAGGELEILSEPGKGTEIRLTVERMP